MRFEIEKNNQKAAFTIVELLTVMSIIVILIGLLVPSLNKVKEYARKVRQKAQFHSIDVAMELFATENDGYPDSSELGGDNNPYCGAMKLCEAMMGQDLMGFHPDSKFRSDAALNGSTYLYAVPGFNPPTDNLGARSGPYLQLENANAYRFGNLYGTGGTGTLPADRFVLCDVYKTVIHKDYENTNYPGTGKKIGMPILYYKANLSGTKNPNSNNSVSEDDSDNIYDYTDNDTLVLLGTADAGDTHPMASTGTFGTPPIAASPKDYFYEYINNPDIPITDGRPFRMDSYILLSAGYDGEYGTRDDIYNFGM